MTNIQQIIDESNLSDELKVEFKDLSGRFLQALNDEASALKTLYETKGQINERQYEQRMSQSLTQEKREQIVINQHAYRNLFANAVLSVHENRLVMTTLAAQIQKRVAEIGNQQADCMFALVALTRLVRDVSFGAIDDVLNELETVSHCRRDRILESVRSIFCDKKSKSGMLATTNFSCAPFQFANRTPVQEELDKAVKEAIDIREHFEDLWSEFCRALSKYNPSQFTQRVEQALSSGQVDKVELIRRDRNNAEAELFIASLNYMAAYPRLVEVGDALEAAVNLASSAAKQLDTSIENLKVMSHCLNGWLYLGELRGYIADKYRGSDPVGVLSKLDFDAKAYIAA